MDWNHCPKIIGMGVRNGSEYALLGGTAIIVLSIQSFIVNEVSENRYDVQEKSACRWGTAALIAFIFGLICLFIFFYQNRDIIGAETKKSAKEHISIIENSLKVEVDGFEIDIERDASKEKISKITIHR